MGRRTPILIALATLGYATLAALRLVWPAGWPTELLALFQPHLVLLGLALLAVSLLFRRGLWQAFLAVIVGGAAWPLIVSAVPLAATVEISGLRVLSANVFRENRTTADFQSLVAEFDPDVIVLEEVAGPFTDLVQAFPDYPNVASPWDVPQGVVVLSRLPMTSGPIPGLDEPGRGAGGGLGLRAVIETAAGPVTVYAIHAPTPKTRTGWRGRELYLDQIAAALSGEDPDARIMVAGDWNTPPWSPLYASFFAETGLTATETSAWPRATRRFGDSPPLSWIGSPIDHIAVTPNISRATFAVGPEFGSDHLPILVELGLGGG